MTHVSVDGAAGATSNRWHGKPLGRLPGALTAMATMSAIVHTNTGLCRPDLDGFPRGTLLP